METAGKQPAEEILRVRGLKTHFPLRRGLFSKSSNQVVRAVDGVDLTLHRGETLGLVGESGCGKSTLARSILQLAPVTEGTVHFKDIELTGRSTAQIRAARLQLQMVFQDPYASLNPRMRVEEILTEPLLAHDFAKRATVGERVAELMNQVGLSPRFARKYPHEFSGGQRQRIAIARALALKPSVIIADEPVSALDVSIQAQILNLFSRLTKELNLSLIFIAHDLSVVKHIADRIAVMYLGKIVEIGTAAEVIEYPRHPYTQALVSAIPIPDPDLERKRERIVLRGDPPSPSAPPIGCAFHPRCPYAAEKCATAVPVLCDAGANRQAACIRLGEF